MTATWEEQAYGNQDSGDSDDNRPPALGTGSPVEGLAVARPRVRPGRHSRHGVGVRGELVGHRRQQARPGRRHSIIIGIVHWDT
ncbi:MAG: hypothetical protein WAL41_18690 [Mycobacterium sp.]